MPTTSTSSAPHEARPALGTPQEPDDDAVVRLPHTTLLVHGSFFLADCSICDWTGSARRVRHTAVRDALRHRGACPGAV